MSDMHHIRDALTHVRRCVVDLKLGFDLAAPPWMSVNEYTLLLMLCWLISYSYS